MSNPRAASARAVLLAGILPVVIFTVVEEVYGTLWGLIIGMAFGLGEIAYEWFRFKKVESITLFGNGLLLVMGSISLFTKEGIWFKLQPAIMEAVMAVVLCGSTLIGKPLLIHLARKQGTLANVPPARMPEFLAAFNGLNFRLGLFFLSHAGLATYAAFYWSTRDWALLKGVGLTVSMILYLGIEVLCLRRQMRA